MQDSSSDSSTPPSINREGFWTPGRILLSLIGVALISAFGLSSCNSAERNTNQPGVARSGSPANGSSPASTDRDFLCRLQNLALYYFLDNQVPSGLFLDRQRNHGPRLAHADWLDKHGRRPRARFIRLEVARARAPSAFPDREAEVEAAELQTTHRTSWLAGLPKEVLELMNLYPQPVRTQSAGGVEYLPVPRQKEVAKEA